jgi:anti-sigma B factor antagonist
MARTISGREFGYWAATERINVWSKDQPTPSGLVAWSTSWTKRRFVVRKTDELPPCELSWKAACKTPDCPEDTDDSGLCGQTRERVWEGRLKRIPLASSGSISITVDQSESETLVRLNGRIDVDSSPDLRDCLLAILSEERLPRAVTVNLAGVPYIETSGIATLIEALRIARHHQAIFCLQALSGPVLRLFEVTGVRWARESYSAE